MDVPAMTAAVVVYVVLWASAIGLAVIALALVHVLTTPIDGDRP